MLMFSSCSDCGCRFRQKIVTQLRCDGCKAYRRDKYAAKSASDKDSGEDDGIKREPSPAAKHLYKLVHERQDYPAAIVHEGGDYRVVRAPLLDSYQGREALRRIVLVCDETTTVADIQEQL